jgi:hypothetical protein
MADAPFLSDTSLVLKKQTEFFARMRLANLF